MDDLTLLVGMIDRELGLARTGEGYEPGPVAAELVAAHVAPLLAEARAERDLLLWLHAEAVWQRDEHEKTMREFAGGGISRLADYLSAQLEATRLECARLRREVEFEANGELPRSSGLALPVCACLADGVVLPAPWTPPQCVVHPDGGESDG